MTTESPNSPSQAPLGGLDALGRDAKGVKSHMKRWLDVLGSVLALAAIFIVFTAVIGKSFANFGNIENILRQTTITCAAALGATFIIVSAGIDLSIGSAVALCAMVIAQMLTWIHHANPADPDTPVLFLDVYPKMWPLVAALTGVGVGLLTGLFNGLLITTLRLAPFIVTLGSMMIFRGVTEMISITNLNNDANWMKRVLDPAALTPEMKASSWKWLLQWFHLAPGLWLILGLAVVCAVVLNYFRFGRHVIAIGSNEQTARLCGIPVNRNKVYIYLVAGFFAGIAGIMQYARQKQGSPTADLGLELDVIAAVVIGGASLNGGKGSILGTIVGSLIMTVIASGLAQVPIPEWVPARFGQGVGLTSFVQKIVTGIIIIVAVALDNLRQRRPT